MIGEKFHMLKVLSLDHKDERYRKYYKCLCDCGETAVVRRDLLKSGNNKSCGCLLRKNLSTGMREFSAPKHGETETKLYKRWSWMKYRCSESASGKDIGKNYFDSGIRVCEEWQDYENFRDWALANGYSEDLTIERKNVYEDYSPENCCFVGRKEQNRNKRNTIFLEFNGEKKSMIDWAETLGLTYSQVYQRYMKNPDPEFVLRKV